jgi:hypothetical protein
MRKLQQASFGLASFFVAAALVGFDTTLAMACSSGSSSSGLSHGSKMGSGSVTVCVGTSTSSPKSSSTQTITKTVTVQVPPKSKPAKKPVAKPAKKPVAKPSSVSAPKPVVEAVSCPSASQKASMPKSADAAERWVQSVCSPAPKVAAAPKSTPKPSSNPTPKTKTKTITETIIVDVPGNYYSAADAVEFQPNPLIAAVFPAKVLSLGQLAKFSSNPSSHFGSGIVLGRQAEVHFVPVRSSWRFSDGSVAYGADTQRQFKTAGKYQIRAFAEYSASYRLVGESGWQAVDGTLLIESNLLEVVVGGSGSRADQSTQGVLLVGADCSGRTGVFGCDI